MSVLVTIQHPAHVHFFKNTIWELEQRGIDVDVVARKKDIALDLLEKYDIEHKVIAGEQRGLIDLAAVQTRYELEIFRTVRKKKPEILMSIGEPGVAHVSRITSAKSFLFTDTEHATLQNAIAFPFADRVYTPDCFEKSVRGNHKSYPGYHELAYLHPNWFQPDPHVFDNLDIEPEDKIVIIRLVSWEAAHDIGDNGFCDIVAAVDEIEKTGAEVIISSEADVPEEIAHCHTDIPVEKMHDLMYYSNLFIGESATMAAESAVLGTPSVFISSSRRGYTNELEEKYKLVHNFSGKNRQNNGINKARSILSDYEPSVWDRRHENMMSDMVDTSKYILSEVNNTLENMELQSDSGDSFKRLSG